MKVCRFLVPMTVAIGLVISGCEWESSDDSSTYNDSGAYDWANFSGTYRPDEGTYIVVVPAAPATGAEATENASGSLATSSGATAGNGVDTRFYGTMSHLPIVPGSVTVTDRNELIQDDGAGAMDGSIGGPGIGSINYDTGVILVNFAIPPANGASIVVSYQYYIEGTTENPSTGSGRGISSLTVHQVGNVIQLTDNYGGYYAGHISNMTEPPASATNAMASGSFHVTANFEATGSSTWNSTVTIVGTLDGDKLIEEGSMDNRAMRGSWLESSGSGTIAARADD